MTKFFKDAIRSSRVWVLGFGALLVLAVHALTDPAGGADTKVRIVWMMWLLVCAGPAYLIARALMGDNARSGQAWAEAIRGNTSAALLWLGLMVLRFGVLYLLVASSAAVAQPLPPNAALHLPTLQAEKDKYWPDAPYPEMLAAQVEKETCITLKHARCWSPRAELKTSREYGFGLGQITITKAFDNFANARKLDSSLADWAFEDRYDAARQLRVLVLMNRAEYGAFGRVAASTWERQAMAFSAYNGGRGGVMADRRVCAATAGCDPARWFGHVAHTSLKAKVAAQGYGKSFFQINREYVEELMLRRRAKYLGHVV